MPSDYANKPSTQEEGRFTFVTLPAASIYAAARCPGANLDCRGRYENLRLMFQGWPRLACRAKTEGSFWCWAELFTVKPIVSKRQATSTTPGKPGYDAPHLPAPRWATFIGTTHSVPRSLPTLLIHVTPYPQ